MFHYGEMKPHVENNLTSFLGLQQMVVRACGCTAVYLVIITNNQRTDCQCLLYDSFEYVRM